MSSVKAGYNNGLKKRGGHSTKQDPSKVDTTGERVIEPRQVDVLCGRGGMSNHHPGNEWYRRLIRSNRPLYRACPKHTKLLVAKAIVQAVEQQDGRFLERDLRTGFWYPVQYKRAVDKTSQGLRERDRDDGTTGGTSEEGGESKSDDEYAVPESFSGKSKKPPNLRILAQVAIDSANRDRMANEAAWPPAAVPVPVPTLQTSISQQSVSQQSVSHQSTTDHSSSATPAADRRVSNVYNALHRPSPPPASSPAPAPLDMAQQAETIVRQTITNMNRSTSGSMAAAATTLPANARTSSDDDLMPLPPSMQFRESSMFRMLKHTQLLPKPSALPKRTPASKDTSIVAGSYNRRLPLNTHANPMYNASLSSPNASPATTPKNVYMAPQPPYAHHYGAVGPSVMYGMYHGAPQPAPPQQQAQAPRPTPVQNRLQYTAQQQQQYQSQLPTTAPLRTGTSTGSQPVEQYGQEPTAPLRAGTSTGSQPVAQYGQEPSQQYRPSQPSMGQQPQLLDANQSQSNAPALTRFTSQVSDWLNSFWPTDNPNMAQQTSVPPTSTQSNTMESTRALGVPPPTEAQALPSLSLAWGMSTATLNGATETATTATATTAPSSSRKRKAQASLPRLPYYGAHGSSDVEHDPGAADLSPTELEQSVSATLLKMAGAPSKLFSGLTSFFVDRGVSTVVTEAAAAAASGPASQKRSQASLLDDYEESPMEARLRAVQYA